ncbi:MAG: DUF2169 domain-containing protein [Polyangiaceae bacterium]|nr:DUF2169 domain-containing protein [Polyangiaceae bacterium]
MEIESLCPFQAGAVLWEPRIGEHRLTVCAKITLALAHGRTASVAPAPQQIPLHDDLFWDRNTAGSLYAPSDFAPQKPRADILLVGHAHAPGGAPVTSLLARLRVGSFVKALHIDGDRVWTGAPEGLRPSPARPFIAMPLRFERAPSGPMNPVGIDPAIQLGKPLANIFAVGEAKLDRGAPGFGPTSPAWRARRFQHGLDIARWTDAIRHDPGPAPPSLDLAFFNAAPLDQQVDEIPAGAEIVLENLCPGVPILATRLPPLSPRAFRVSKATGLSYEIPLRCDTLWIDGDRALAVLCFRGVADVNEPRSIGRVVIAVEPEDRPEPIASSIAVEPLIQSPQPLPGDSQPRLDLRRTQPLAPPSQPLPGASPPRLDLRRTQPLGPPSQPLPGDSQPRLDLRRTQPLAPPHRNPGGEDDGT